MNRDNLPNGAREIVLTGTGILMPDITAHSVWVTSVYILFAFLVAFPGCQSPEKSPAGYSFVTRVESGTPVSVLMTAYSTTLLANGEDRTVLRIAVADSLGREITSATDTIRLFVEGDGRIGDKNGADIVLRADTAGKQYGECCLEKGASTLLFIAGTQPGIVKVEARSGKLRPGSHEIHTIPGDMVLMKPDAEQLPPTTKPLGRMIGADISFLPQMEERGRKFSDNGLEKDAIILLRDHGFNTIRLRIFVNPENEKGYSPGKGYCGLSHTLAMARRVKDAGMKLLLDFHYSDYWADPQQQNKPKAWAELGFNTLVDSVKDYTARVLLALQQQGTLPDMVQVGNEINHGMLWPEGHIGRPDQMAGLLKAGVEGVEAVDPAIPVMMHIALGGQNKESVFWLDNILARGVRFDIIGLSYYPRWHGTLDDLHNNLADLLKRYHKPLNVVEYSEYKREVHDIIFSLPGDMGKGACIWEPLSWGEPVVSRDGETNDLILVFDKLRDKYLVP